MTAKDAYQQEVFTALDQHDSEIQPAGRAGGLRQAPERERNTSLKHKRVDPLRLRNTPGLRWPVKSANPGVTGLRIVGNIRRNVEGLA